MVKQKAPLAQLVDAAKAGMDKLASQGQSLGAPYYYVTITTQGITGL